MNQTHHIVRMDTRLIFEGSFYLPARAMKVLAYVIAKFVDPTAKSLPPKVWLSIRDIQAAIYGNTHKNGKYLYKEIDQICRDLTQHTIHFPTGIEVAGLTLKGYINWVSAAIPLRKEDQLLIELEFGQTMQQFLLGLSSYVRLHLKEIQLLKRAHAIRLFQIFRGKLNQSCHFGKKQTELRFELKQLKSLMGIANKHKHYRDFSRGVLKSSIEEINQKTSLRITEWNPIKANGGRTVTHIIFHLQDNTQRTDTLPDAQQLFELSEARLRGYELLVEDGIYPGIAYRMVQEIKGSEIEGYEDKFVAFALEWAHEKSAHYSPGVFVNWWVEKRCFDPQGDMPDLWAHIQEQIIVFKTEQQRLRPEEYRNRMLAKEMSSEAFRSAHAHHTQTNN